MLHNANTKAVGVESLGVHFQQCPSTFDVAIGGDRNKNGGRFCPFDLWDLGFAVLRYGERTIAEELALLRLKRAIAVTADTRMRHIIPDISLPLVDTRVGMAVVFARGSKVFVASMMGFEGIIMRSCGRVCVSVRRGSD
jgi:hypothetical protein